MKIALIYSINMSNNYIIKYLNQRKNIVLKVGEVENIIDIAKRTIKRTNDTIPSKLYKFAFYFYYFVFLKYKVDRQLEKKNNNEEIKCDIMTDDVNDSEVLRNVKNSRADIILLLGTSLLKNHWFDLGIPIVNIHTGITPFYRGRFCWFWPIFDKEYDKIGITSHIIDSGVDSGKVIVQKKLDLKKVSKPEIGLLLVEIVHLICKTIDETFDIVKNNKEYGYLPKDRKKYKVRLEPGLNDYFVFKKNFREFVET